MTTLLQLVREAHLKKKHKVRRKVLQGRPQLRGVCIKIRIMAPKKPNSAERKVARLRLSTGKAITASIPGEGHKLQQFSSVLIRGGRVRDLPGIQYKIIRGALDATGVAERGQRRSKFGTKKKAKKDESGSEHK